MGSLIARGVCGIPGWCELCMWMTHAMSFTRWRGWPHPVWPTQQIGSCVQRLIKCLIHQGRPRNPAAFSSHSLSRVRAVTRHVEPRRRFAYRKQWPCGVSHLMHYYRLCVHFLSSPPNNSWGRCFHGIDAIRCTMSGKWPFRMCSSTCVSIFRISFHYLYIVIIIIL